MRTLKMVFSYEKGVFSYETRVFSYENRGVLIKVENFKTAHLISLFQLNMNRQVEDGDVH